ncbi:hypothetical protein U3653_07195 [Nocardia sp. CDC186]|uniref:Uncharacterized protein n=1 Tax=Nocardia implantans TaxID=3108168 RepID=A0ABU6AQQ6_9NOCA|nr:MULTISPECIES: hypothetical protein [unclassified Nocardia]MBF6190138.1 hypothetical protein [Nocardia beijingensis]MEA3526629.1 hypothetical protein [Nocardia sp. CDC192]MEB3509794.1 hypothetical protein [Nocardia sp. CDC186]
MRITLRAPRSSSRVAVPKTGMPVASLSISVRISLCSASASEPGQAQMRVHALPQHRTGDVEAVELDLLRAELHAQHRESVGGLAMTRNLQVEHGRRILLPDPRPQLGDQPGLADPADSAEQHDPGTLGGLGQQFVEPRQHRFAVDERTAGRSRLEPRGQHHGVSPS